MGCRGACYFYHKLGLNVNNILFITKSPRKKPFFAGSVGVTPVKSVEIGSRFHMKTGGAPDLRKKDEKHENVTRRVYNKWIWQAA